MYETGAGTGTFTSKIFLMIPLIISTYLFLKYKNSKIFVYYKNERWIGVLALLIIISLVNIHNFAFMATIAFAILVVSYLLFFKLIYNLLSPAEIIEGIYSSFLFLCILDFILAILYPVLNMSFVTTLFQNGGEEWSTRGGTRAGAIGVFVTPANLGLYTTIAASFFLASYLGYNKRNLSIILLIISLITIFLTYARTSYITVIIVLFFMLFINKNAKKPLFSLKTVFFGLCPILIILYWLVFLSPLSAIFLKTNADDMYQARIDHVNMGMQIFNSSPIIGVGINTHLEYVNRNIALYRDVHNDFLTSNPIHNTHLIILVETGVIGLLLWIIFLFTSIWKAKYNIANNTNIILSLTQIGLLITFIIYGFTDWAPLSPSIFPIFLMFTYFTNKFSISLNAKATTAHLINNKLIVSDINFIK